MNRVDVLAVCGIVVMGAGVWAAGAVQEQRLSPHETVSAQVDGAKMSVTYGRPYKKGRVIFGGLVPYGQVWRTGADEATTLTTDKALMFGNLHVNPGSVTLFTLPTEKGPWKLIINKQTGQAGTEYDEKQDVGRVDMKVETIPSPVEQFTIAIQDTPQGGQLVMTWDTTRMTIPFSAM
jgi:Protein of unknown function (DUF2911)